MTHQINLLQLRTEPRGPRLSLTAVLAAAVATAALMAMLAGQAGSALKPLRERVLALEQAASVRSVHDAGIAQDPVVAALEATLALRKTELDELQGMAGRDRSGYTEFFRALARASTDGTWLTAVSVDRRGATLQGRALSPERVAAYLAHLQTEPDFRGQTFNTVEFNSGSDRAGPRPAGTQNAPRDWLEFTLSTHEAEAVGDKTTSAAERH